MILTLATTGALLIGIAIGGFVRTARAYDRADISEAMRRSK